MTKMLRTLGITLILIVVTGCAALNLEAETAVTFYENEGWEGQAVLTIPAETMAFLESSEDFDYETFKQEFEQEMLADTPEDVEVTFVEERLDSGELVVTVSGQGQGFDTLQETLFDENAEVTVNEEQQIEIRWSIPLGSQYFSKNTLKISGNEIVSSNADHSDGKTAVWVNPTLVEVTLTETPRSSFGCLPIGLVILGGVVWVSRFNKKEA